MKYKHNWDEAREHFIALWEGRHLGRPCIAVTAPNGPAHMELYKKIQAAGKIVHLSVPKENVEPLCRALDPARLCLKTSCGSPAEAEELLSAAKRWT